MRVVADTGPLVAAANRRDEAHALAAALVVELGRDLIVPTPVVTETDQLLRARVSSATARGFLDALAQGAHTVAYLTPGLLRRSAAIDARFAALDLGFADACVMAIAERDRLPILTFDFGDFTATRPARGFWRLVVDERRYRESLRRRR